MTVAVKTLHPLFAAELTGLDLTRPLSPAEQQAVTSAMDEHAVVAIPGQDFDNESQVAFSLQFGQLETAPMIRGKDGGGHRISEHVFDASNLDENGRILALDDDRRAYRDGNRQWHTDSSFRQRSATWSLLHARAIPPEGGDTLFADTRAAYDALPDGMKARLEGLVAEHSIWYSRSTRGNYQPSAEELRARPPAQHKLVRVHPGSGRKTLYIASHVSHIVGWPVEEGRALIRELMAHATQDRFVYRHAWRRHELVIWDNRCTMHAATPFDDVNYVRDMRRTTIIDPQWEIADAA